MQTISSGLTVFSKRIFPAILVVAITFFAFIALAGILKGSARTLSFFITPLVILAIVYVYWLSCLSWLADEVTDYGAYLLVRLGAAKDRIPLANIKDVEVSGRYQNKLVMTLHLVQPCRFGDSVSFLPLNAFPFTGWGRGKMDEDLLQRADAARREAHPLPGIHLDRREQ